MKSHNDAFGSAIRFSWYTKLWKLYHDLHYRSLLASYVAESKHRACTLKWCYDLKLLKLMIYLKCKCKTQIIQLLLLSKILYLFSKLKIIIIFFARWYGANIFSTIKDRFIYRIKIRLFTRAERNRSKIQEATRLLQLLTRRRIITASKRANAQSTGRKTEAGRWNTTTAIWYATKKRVNVEKFVSPWVQRPISKLTTSGGIVEAIRLVVATGIIIFPRQRATWELV